MDRGYDEDPCLICGSHYHWFRECPQFDGDNGKYDVDPCSCCGSYNHWAQDCPHSEQGYYQSDYGSRRYQNYNQSNKVMDRHNRNPNSDYLEEYDYEGSDYFQECDQVGFAKKTLEVINTIVKRVKEIYQSFDEQQKINESLAQQIGQLTDQFNEFLERKSERLETLEEIPVEKVTPVIVMVDDVRLEKDRELGEPLIPIQLGDFKTDNALLDYGARMSVLPGYVYDMYELGPLHQVDASMVLAEYSRERPRGILKGLTVKVGDFYYPEDFVVLEVEPYIEKEQPRVILGRPFLATADAQISCRNGAVDMTYGSRKLSVDFLSHSFDYSLTNTCPWSFVTNKSHSPMCDDGPKESVAMIDRSKDEKVVKDKVVKLPWWLKMRNKKSSTKSEKKSPNNATNSKKRPLEVNMGEFSQLKDEAKSKKKLPKENADESLFFVDYDDPDVMDAYWNEGWQWDTNRPPGEVLFAREIPFEPP